MKCSKAWRITLIALSVLMMAACDLAPEMVSSTGEDDGESGGAVSVVYEEPADEIEAATEEALKASGAIESAVALIDETFELPEPLHVVIGGEDGPLYDPEYNEILIPYAFAEEVEDRFTDADYAETGVSPADATADALMHTVFHEIGHAFIVMYELPVLGKEEDAVDALANVLLIEFYDGGGDIAISAADLFDLESADVDVLEDQDFWDEHSLDAQRYFSTLCHVYGSDPQTYDFLVEEADFSEDRSELCVEEYGTIADSWLGLLEPYMK